MKKRKIFWLPILVAFTLILSACGGSSKEPTPTPIDPNLIAAQAIATFAMGLTQTAFAQPTATLTPEPTATNTIAPTFAALGTNTGIAPVNTCDTSAFVSDVTYPDGTVMAPGQVFVKTWQIRNTGTCTWTATYKAFYTGSRDGPMGGVATPIGKTVKTGDTIEISITFTAPSPSGEYLSWWRLQNDSAAWVGGDAFSVLIKVVGATATATDTSNSKSKTNSPEIRPIGLPGNKIWHSIAF